MADMGQAGNCAASIRGSCTNTATSCSLQQSQRWEHQTPLPGMLGEMTLLVAALCRPEQCSTA